MPSKAEIAKAVAQQKREARESHLEMLRALEREAHGDYNAAFRTGIGDEDAFAKWYSSRRKLQEAEADAE